MRHAVGPSKLASAIQQSTARAARRVIESDSDGEDSGSGDDPHRQDADGTAVHDIPLTGYITILDGDIISVIVDGVRVQASIKDGTFSAPGLIKAHFGKEHSSKSRTYKDCLEAMKRHGAGAERSTKFRNNTNGRSSISRTLVVLTDLFSTQSRRGLLLGAPVGQHLKGY